jgi:DNA-binding Lrp family transcriptional regulator
LRLRSAPTWQAAIGLTWASPGRLEAIGHQLSRHPQVRFAAATTGPANLLVAVAAENLGGLYAFLTETVGSIDSVRGLEVTRILSSVKRAGLIRPPET